MTTLSLKKFLPNQNKVGCVEFHPVQPWVVIVDKNNVVHVWNWASGEVIYAAQYGSGDEHFAQQHALQRLAEMDPAYFGDRSVPRDTPTRTGTGRVRVARFVDADTLYWERNRQLTMIRRIVDDSLDSRGVGLQRGQRWIVVVCDNKVLFVELQSLRTREIPKQALEGKTPNTVEVLVSPASSSMAGEPVVAIGCTDGSVRLFSLLKLKPVGKLVHKTSTVSVLRVVYLDNASVRLVGGYSDGPLAVWDPLPPRRKDVESSAPMSPAVVAKGHESEVTDIIVVPGMSNSGLGKVFSIGSDRNVVVLEVGPFNESKRFKQPGRSANHSCCYSPSIMCLDHPGALLMASNASTIWAVSMTGISTKEICDLMGLALPGGGRKPYKIMSLAVHPVQHTFFAVGTTLGMVMLSLDQQQAPPVAPLPALVTNQAGGTAQIGALIWSENKLWHKEYMTVEEGTASGSKTISPEPVLSKQISTESEETGVASVSLNASGTKCAVVWPESRKYAVFRSAGAGSWKRCGGGNATAVAWHSHFDHLALKEELPLSKPQVAPKRDRLNKAKQAAADAAAAAAAEAAASMTSVKLYAVPTSGEMHQEADVDLRGDYPAALHGGPLLGVTIRHRQSAPTMRFYTWRSQEMCGSDFPAPQWVGWSPQFDLCVMAYDSHLMFSKYDKQFSPMMTIPVAGALGGVWHGRQLYLVTATSVECVVVLSGEKKKKGKNFQVVQLASYDAGSRAALSRTPGYREFLPVPRPVGDLQLLGLRGEDLWMTDPKGTPVLLRLGHAGFASLRHISSNHLVAARNSAEGELPADSVAALLLVGGQRSASEVLNLQNMSLELRMKVALQAGLHKHAFVCFEALAAGCKSPNVLTRLESYQESIKDTSPFDDFPPEGLSPTGDLFSVLNAPGTTLPGASDLLGVDLDVTDAIDWDAPLRGRGEFKQPAGKPCTAYMAPEVAAEGLHLIDASMKAHTNVARRVVRVFMSSSIDPATRVQLASRMANLGMKEQVAVLASLSEKDKMSAAGRLSGLIAAGLTSDPLLMSTVLQDLQLTAPPAPAVVEGL